MDRDALRLLLMPRWIPPLEHRPMEPERAARAAQRRNDRLKAKVPLFAEDGEITGATWTGDAFADQVERRMRYLHEAWDRQFDTALAYRDAAGRLVSPEQIEAWDEYFRSHRWLPHSEEYLADYWWHKLRDLGLSRAQIETAIGREPSPSDRYFDECDRERNQ